MLTDISSFAAEAVLQGFAPSLLDLAPSELPAELLYLRFAMIAAYLQIQRSRPRLHVSPRSHTAHGWLSKRSVRLDHRFQRGPLFAAPFARPVAGCRGRVVRPHSFLCLPH